jgi:hypothetical protein
MGLFRETPDVNHDATGPQGNRNGDPSVSHRRARDDCGGAGLLAGHPVTGGWDKCAGSQFLGRAARVRWMDSAFPCPQKLAQNRGDASSALGHPRISTPLRRPLRRLGWPRDDHRGCRGNANHVVERPGCAFSARLRGRQYDRCPSRCRSDRSPCPRPHAGTIRRRTNAAGASTCWVMAFHPGLVVSPLPWAPVRPYGPALRRRVRERIFLDR